MNIVHIIGNGFDLNQGLPTSYSHFYEYYLQVVPTADEPRVVSDFRTLLQKKLYENRTDKWADLEVALGELTAEYDSANEYLTIYKNVYQHLISYLNMAYQHSEVEPFEEPFKTFYEDLFSPWRYLVPADKKRLLGFLPMYESIRVSVINFNYTNTLNRLTNNLMEDGLLLGYYKGHSAYYGGCKHIHQKLDGNNIILGVDNAGQIVNTKFITEAQIPFYLIKPQTNAGLGTMVDEECKTLIEKANLICIYGTSVGNTDKTWWLEIAKRLKMSSNTCLMYLPFISNISNDLPIGYAAFRNIQKKHLLETMELNDKEKEKRVFVNICNIPDQSNIFTNPKRKSLSDNFENVMAHFQKEGVIGDPTSGSALFSVTLAPPVGEEPLFTPRVYKERK